MAISRRPFMGATPFAGGVTFRLWAPFASHVFVAGEFNAWSTNSTPLFSESNGYWSVDVPGAVVGQQYKYVIVDQNQKSLWRNDPYARSMTQRGGTLNSLAAVKEPVPRGLVGSKTKLHNLLA